MYDIAIIGAGINGCSVAYEFIKEGKSVILFDKEGIASGGSGAAGAFISPKFSKSGELKEILNAAFKYSYTYYNENFSNFFTKTQLLHIAQDESDDETLQMYKENTEFTLKNISIDAGVVDAQGICNAMANGVKFVKEKVEDLVYADDFWVINETYNVKNVVLATGAYASVMPEPYINLRGVWGHRIDIKTTTKNSYSVHQFVSISSSKEGKLAIGATHNVHYHPDINKEAYNIEEGRKELLQKAAKTLKLDNIEVVKDYTGLRSGSFDYMPLVGSLVLSNETILSCSKKILYQKNPDFAAFTYYPNLYMINGSGGYGFVLAPYLAKILTNHILNATPISSRLFPARFFARWVKKR
jgi:tRNA 5-methylaminomethyl-2-thiouridine biosynthesis bifunctional protein